jgi:lysozyme family protein
MATFNKFNTFVQDIGRKVHNLNSDTLKDALTNTAPNAADTVYDSTTSPPQLSSTSNAHEVAAGNGYSAGGTAIGSTAYSQTSGTATLSGANTVVTASGAVGPFRYNFMYNVTAGTTSTRAPIGWYDYGSSITLASGETFTVDHSANLLTIA